MFFSTHVKPKALNSFLFLLLIAAILTFIPVLNPAPAAADSNEIFSLEKCVGIVLDKSVALSSARKTIESAKWKKSETYKSFLPTLDTTYSYTRLEKAPSIKYVGYGAYSTGLTAPGSIWPVIPIGSTKINVGSANNWQLKATVTQPVFTGFALTSAYEMSKLGIDMAEIAYEKAKLDLVLDVKVIYFAILSAQKAAEVANQAVTQGKAHLNVAKSFYDVGMVPKNQVLQAEVKMAEALQNRIRAENGILMAKASLNNMLGRELEAPLNLEDILSYKPFPHEFVPALEQAFKTRPEIKTLKKKIDLDKITIKLTKAAHYPTIVVLANHTWKGDTWAINGSEFSPDATTWDATAVLTWEVWNWGKTRDKVKQSEIELAKSKAALSPLLDGIALEVKRNFIRLGEAEESISVAKKAIEQAEENYRMSRERYREQVATSTEVTDAATLLTAARRTFYESLFNYHLAWAALERAMGLGRDKI